MPVCGTRYRKSWMVLSAVIRGKRAGNHGHSFIILSSRPRTRSKFTSNSCFCFGTVILAALFGAPPASRPNYLGLVVGVGVGRESERKNSPTGSVFLMVSGRVRRFLRRCPVGVGLGGC